MKSGKGEKVEMRSLILSDPFTVTILIILVVLIIVFLTSWVVLVRSKYVHARCKLYEYEFSLIDLDMTGHCCAEPRGECVELDVLEGVVTATPTPTFTPVPTLGRGEK